MARGKLYEIAENPENLFDMDADTAIERMDMTGVESYQDLDRKESMKGLLETFREAGVEVVSDETGTSITFSRDAKCRYFEKRCEEFKETAAQMTLEDFACESVTQLKWMLEDDYADAVYIPERDTFYSMDEFIRQVPVNTRYYIGNVILMR